MPSRKDEHTSLLSKEVPFLQTTFQEKLSIAKEITLAAIPNIFSSLGSQLKDVISLYFVGHLNNPLFFAAAGFGLTWLNAFGTAVIFGFAAGFGTLASQAFGAKNFYKLGLLYQKSIVVMTCLLALLISVLWFTKAELIMLGFEEELASAIGHFIRYLMIDLIFYMLFEVTKFYLIAQNLFEIPACILFISTSLHIFWCHFFVNVMGLELIGMAIARTITDGTSMALLLIYVKLKNPCPESWFPWNKECLDGLVPYAKDIASHGSSVYIEWIAFEMTTIILGFLGDVTVLAAHSATLNYLFVNSTISLGLTLSMSVYVGNAAGEGSIIRAQKYAYTGLIMNFLVVSCLDILMFIFRGNIAAFYTSETNVNTLIMSMLTLYFCGMHGDLCCNTFAYLLRTLGQDKYVLKGFICSYYGIGVTSSLIFSVWFGFGYYGVWGSLLLGCYVLLLFNFLRFKNLNWELEVNKIYLEMRRKSINEESQNQTELQNFSSY